ncbi:G-protein coupled receptors family 3 profile domain-containing protein [Plasmodiophora brassicae]
MLLHALLVSLVAAGCCRGALGQASCDADPCAYLGRSCCQTYPCANASSTAPVVELAVVIPFDVNANQIAVQLAVDHVNADGTILPGTLKRVRWQSSRGTPVGAMNGLVCTAFTNASMLTARVPMVIGPMFSSEATSGMGQMASFIGLPMIAPVSSSTTLNDKVLYRTVSRMISDDSLAATAIVHIVQHFGWNTVVMVYSSDAQSVSMTQVIVEQCKAAGISILFALIVQLNTIQDTMQRIKDSNVRIVVAPISFADERLFFDAVRAAGLDSSKYVWLAGTQLPLYVTAGLPANLFHIWPYQNASLPQAIDVMKSWGQLYAANPNNTFRLASPVDGQLNVYDAVVFGFTVLHSMRQAGLAWNQTSVLKAIRSTTMMGTTGSIQLNSIGNRLGTYAVWQCHRPINADPYTTPCGWTNVATLGVTAQSWQDSPTPVQWADGRRTPPVEFPQILSTRLAASTGVVVALTALASLGIIVATVFLVFNIYNRGVTFIKMSSPAINNGIILGTILSFVYIVLSAAQESTDDTAQIARFCSSRIAVLCVGFTMAFGGLAAKTYRVSMIFSASKEMKSVAIRTSVLVRSVILLLIVDIVILSAWLGTDPLQAGVVQLPSYDESDSIVRPYTIECSSANINTYLAVIYLYKGAIIVLAAAFAYQTRNVEIPALNDSRQIGLSIFTCSLIAVIVVPILRFINADQPSSSFVLANMSILFSSSATLVILFVPKISAIMDGSAHDKTRRQGPSYPKFISPLSGSIAPASADSKPLKSSETK